MPQSPAGRGGTVRGVCYAGPVPREGCGEQGFQGDCVCVYTEDYLISD